MKPEITVLMPVYNAEKYLPEAIESILGQTLKNFEFLIIDDGSNDNTPELLKKYLSNDRRIRLITHSKNMGLISTLNEGLKEAAGKFIARMDADDISAKERLKKQLDYLKGNKDCIVVGSSFFSIDEAGGKTGRHFCFINNSTIRHALPLEGCIPHPTAMYVKDKVLELGGYRKAYFPAEDYDLWRRISSIGELHNLAEPLLLYRHTTSSISASNVAIQKKMAGTIRREVFKGSKREDLKITIVQMASHGGEHMPSLISLQKRLALMSLKRGRLHLFTFLILDIVKSRIHIHINE